MTSKQQHAQAMCAAATSCVAHTVVISISAAYDELTATLDLTCIVEISPTRVNRHRVKVLKSSNSESSYKDGAVVDSHNNLCND